MFALFQQLPAAAIRFWVRVTGKKISRNDAPWLDCPMGPARVIGRRFYEELADRDGLRLESRDDAGLVSSFHDLNGGEFHANDVHPRVRNFYEQTAKYRLDAWCESSIIMRPFLWLLVRFVSRQMDQLNFPVSPLEVSRGMTSEIVPIVDPVSGHRLYTGWRRRLVAVDRIIYTGLYQSETPPTSSRPYVKVSFPLPHGSATVFLRPESQPDGSLKLISDGKRFGESGFYRMVQIRDGEWKVRFVNTLHEVIHVYVDESDVLRTDHSFTFLGISVLRLHYKMQSVDSYNEERATSNETAREEALA